MNSIRSRFTIPALLLLLVGCVDDKPLVHPLLPDAPLGVVQDPANPVVNTLAMPGDGVCDDVECTLLDALKPDWVADFTIITFAPGLTGTIQIPADRTSGLLLTHGGKIIGPGADKLTIDASMMGSQAFRVGGGVRPWSTYEISGLTINGGGTGNRAITLSSSLSFSDSATIRDVVIKGFRPGNSLTTRQAAVYVVNHALSIINSTITDNHAADAYSGGAVSFLSSSEEDYLRITNSTISGNSGNVGGVIVATTYPSKVIISNSTISGNVGSAAGGVAGSGTVLNTIIANNTGGNCTNVVPEFSSWPVIPLIDAGYNLDSDGTCAFSSGTSISGTVATPIDAKLGALTNNGGVLPTHALLTGSPALNAGSPLFSNPDLPFDQRGSGFPRVTSGRIDIGAFEYQPALLYSFTGFFAPLHNAPAVNIMRAGGAVPVKFSLGGDKGLNVFATDYPRSEAMGCDATATSQDVSATVSAGGSTLAYDAATNVYSYVWKTDKRWAGTCRQLTFTFMDGTTRSALFSFIR